MENRERFVNALGSIIGNIMRWFATALFIWWGWNTFAYHFNLPQFEYIEVFAMRMALTFITQILWQKTNFKPFEKNK